MSLLAEICNFKKDKLKQTTTKVITTDGKTLEESRSKYGRITSKVISKGGQGFVGDVTPDMQVAEVCNGLSFGSQDVAADQSILKASGITHIINLASMVPNQFPQDFVYLQIHVLDEPTSNISQHFGLCTDFIDRAISSGGKCFVHCNAGVSRAASVVIAYMMKTQKKKYQEVFDAIKAIRKSTRPNDGFQKQLIQLEKELA